MWVTSALCVAASKIEQWTSDPAPELDVSVAHRQRHEVALAVGALAGVQQQPVPVERAELELDAQLLVDVVEPNQLQVRATGERRHHQVLDCGAAEKVYSSRGLR